MKHLAVTIQESTDKKVMKGVNLIGSYNQLTELQKIVFNFIEHIEKNGPKELKGFTYTPFTFYHPIFKDEGFRVTFTKNAKNTKKTKKSEDTQSVQSRFYIIWTVGLDSIRFMDAHRREKDIPRDIHRLLIDEYLKYRKTHMDEMIYALTAYYTKGRLFPSADMIDYIKTNYTRIENGLSGKYILASGRDKYSQFTFNYKDKTWSPHVSFSDFYYGMTVD